MSGGKRSIETGAETTGVELRTRLDGVFAQWHNALASNNQSGGARVYAEESYIELYIVTASSPDFTLTKTDGTWAFRGQDWYSSYPSVVRPDQMADYVTQHAFEMAAWQNA